MAVLAAAAAAGLTSSRGSAMRVRCEADKYYDQVARQCTPCTDICDPSRGTDHLCQKHIDVCNGK